MPTYDAISVLGCAAATSSVTVSGSTTTETTLHSKTLPSGILDTAGRNVHLREWGLLSLAAIGTFDVRVKYGNTTVIGFTNAAPLLPLTNGRWRLDGDITTTASGVVEGQGWMIIEDAGQALYSIIDMGNSTTISVPTSGSVTVDFTWQWQGSTSTSNSITRRSGLIEAGGLI